MNSKHITARGKAVYYKGLGDDRVEMGREWFSRTRYEDGQHILRVQCELEAGLIAPRSVMRELIYTTDRHFAPIDCYNRLHVNGEFMGAGWMRFSDRTIECETLSAPHGRYSQRIEIDGPIRALCAHPITSDAMALSWYDHALPETVQHQPRYWMSSLEHDGASGPLVGSLPLDIAYCGRETITVAAGTFEADRYRFIISTASGSGGNEHPTEDIWVTPGDFIFLKATVGGYIDSSFELTEFTGWE